MKRAREEGDEASITTTISRLRRAFAREERKWAHRVLEEACAATKAHLAHQRHPTSCPKIKLRKGVEDNGDEEVVRPSSVVKRLGLSASIQSELRSLLPTGKSTVATTRLPAAQPVPPFRCWVMSADNSIIQEDIKRRLLYADREGEMLAGSDLEEDPDAPPEEPPEESADDRSWSRGEDMLLVGVATTHGSRTKPGSSPAVLHACAETLGISTSMVEQRIRYLLNVKAGDAAADGSAGAAAAAAAGRSRGHRWLRKLHATYDTPLSGEERKQLAIMALGRKLPSRAQAQAAQTPPIDYDDIDVALDTFRTLYCRRCHVFDCKLHGCGQLLPPQRRPAARPAQEAAAPPQPCGAACRHLQAPPAAEQTVWTPMEETFFTVAHGMFGSDACGSARLLGSRSCAEVARRIAAAAAAAGDSEEDDDEAAGGALRLPRGHRRHRRRGGASNIKSSRKKATATIRRRLTNEDQIRAQYTPCGCDEAGCNASCPCVEDGNFCEKFCGCPPHCKNSFPGCSCLKGQCRTRACPCFAASRECDPDLCRRCCPTAARTWYARAGLLIPPSPSPAPAAAVAASSAAAAAAAAADNPSGGAGGGAPAGGAGGAGGSAPSAEAGETDCCENMKLLLRQHKRVLLGRSEIAGWGAFLGDPARKQEYVGEYTGELISQAEADRRGKIYDRNNCSFLFNLNSEWVLDAQVKGNKMKFANHSLTPNSYTKVVMVSGDHRVGIYAKQNLPAGSELVYDYRYEPDKAPDWALQANSNLSGSHT